jgi:hypothetical protein
VAGHPDVQRAALAHPRVDNGTRGFDEPVTRDAKIRTPGTDSSRGRPSGFTRPGIGAERLRHPSQRDQGDRSSDTAPEFELAGPIASPGCKSALALVKPPCETALA